ncbi:MAG: hypothetical protein CMQ38_12575 [Gammaproteobacteria bacterium]|mgnify:FL=1|nr:hypothetical protein [Gammaproteobacteria bacterium]|tara:strand:- start:8193 stop:8852 length:660 start_codon:yes stop_codon:yes gene_type:complete
MSVKKIDQVASIENLVKASSGPKSSDARRADASRDHVDVINQIFAEFELAYHNQYRKAYPDEAAVKLGKKYWLECLSDYPATLLLQATRELVKTHSYLPTVADLVNVCKRGVHLFGLPDPREAYLEACRAASPKAAQKWSHTAVYLAGKNTGWFELANKPEGQIFPLFEYNYSQLCQRVLAGEDLYYQQDKALSQETTSPLSNKDNLSRLEKLRKDLFS